MKEISGPAKKKKMADNIFRLIHKVSFKFFLNVIPFIHASGFLRFHSCACQVAHWPKKKKSKDRIFFCNTRGLFLASFEKKILKQSLCKENYAVAPFSRCLPPRAFKLAMWNIPMILSKSGLKVSTKFSSGFGAGAGSGAGNLRRFPAPETCPGYFSLCPIPTPNPPVTVTSDW